MGKAALRKKRLKVGPSPRNYAEIRSADLRREYQRGSAALGGWPHHSHIGEVAEALLVVEAIADHELIGDLEPHVLDRCLHPPALRLGQQGADLDRRGLPCAQALEQVVEGQPRVDDV